MKEKTKYRLVNGISLLPLLAFIPLMFSLPDPNVTTIVFGAYIVVWIVGFGIYDRKTAKHWKRSVLIRLMLIPVIPLLTVVVIGLGFNSFYNIYHRVRAPDTLKLALNIDELPESVSHIRIGVDDFPDYIAYIYCEIDPADFPELISGHPFTTNYYGPHLINPPDYAKSIPNFEATEMYHFSPGGLTTFRVETTKEHDKLYVVYGTD